MTTPGRGPVNAIILCGGRASRMGFDKAFIKFGGRTLVERQVNTLKGRFKKIILVTNLPYEYKSMTCVKVVPDIVQGLGPLGGLYTGLKASDARYNFVTACDMPFLEPDLAAYMAGSIKEGFQAVVPFYRNQYEPLCALYSLDCIDKISEALSAGKLKLARLLSGFKVRKVLRRELVRFGDPEVFFRNINTPQDLQSLKSFEH